MRPVPWRQTKQRLTMLVCGNMMGTDKRPLLVLVKSAKPRCFKHVKSLPTEYKSNKKAWMTSQLFEAWVRQIDKAMTKKGKKVALVVDNCPAHPNINGLNAVEMVFLPPNTTSKTQPMDQGVIQSLKCQYRKRVLLKAIRAIDNGPTLAITVYDALEMLQQAWNSVTSATLRNCFPKAGFVADVSAPSTQDYKSDEDPEDDIPLARLSSLGLNQASARDFLSLDDDLPICRELSDTDIIEEIRNRRQPMEDDNEEEDEEIQETPAPSTDQLLSACEILRNHFRTKDISCDILKQLCSISDRIAKDDLRKCTKQTSITSFFK